MLALMSIFSKFVEELFLVGLVELRKFYLLRRLYFIISKNIE